MLKYKYLFLFFALYAGIITRCVANENKTDETKEQSFIDKLSNKIENFFTKEEEIDLGTNDPEGEYYAAMEYYTIGNYSAAIMALENIERRYPTFVFATKVLVMQAFIQYLDKEYEKASGIVDAFMSLYPQSPYMPYMEYLKTMCIYRRISGITKSYEMLLQSRLEMLTIAAKYKDTIYGDEAKKYSDKLHGISMYAEIKVGESYQYVGDYFAAIKRYNNIIKNQVTNLLPIASYRLYECYRDLGIADQSEYYYNTTTTLMANYEGDENLIIGDEFSYLANTTANTNPLPIEVKISNTFKAFGGSLATFFKNMGRGIAQSSKSLATDIKILTAPKQQRASITQQIETDHNTNKEAYYSTQEYRNFKPISFYEPTSKDEQIAQINTSIAIDDEEEIPKKIKPTKKSKKNN
jgi:outer membrane protein assembly factor BamD